MRKELWDIACSRWDEDDAKALYKVFSEYFDDEHWDEYCSLAFIGTDKDVDDFIFNDFIEINEINPTVEFYLDRDKVVSDWGIDYSREEVTTDEGYTRTVVCREFQIGGIMAKPKLYTMFVSFSAMDMEQAIEYIHELDDKDIRSCLEEE